jgi:ABC-type phosphate transport system substrate-binding protein
MNDKIRSCHINGGLLIRAAVSLLFAASLLPASSAGASDEGVVIAGAGPSTKVVERFVVYLAKNEAARGMTFSVPKKSIKHAGGIRSTEKHLFGRTGRPLNEKEKAVGVEEIFLAKMPIVFIAGVDAGVSSLTLDQVCGIFTGKHRNWKEVGGNDKAISIITREPTEALFLELKNDLPCMKEVIATKYVLKKDDHVIEMVKTTEIGQSAISFGAARNFPEKVHIAIDGFDSGVRLGLVYQTANKDKALVKAARETAASEEWKSELRSMGLGLP